MNSIPNNINIEILPTNNTPPSSINQFKNQLWKLTSILYVLLQNKMSVINKYFYLLLDVTNKRFQKSNPPTLFFSVFGLINYPLFFLFFYIVTPGDSAGELMRVSATILCALVLLKKSWPQYLKIFFPIFWYVTVLYIVPLFGTYLFFKNHGSISWLSNALVAIFWLILITDWLEFIIILPLGIILGWFSYHIINGPIYLNLNNSDMIATLANYFCAIVVAAIFARNKTSIVENITNYFFRGDYSEIKKTQLLTSQSISVINNTSTEDISQLTSTAINLLVLNTIQLTEINPITFPISCCIHEMLYRYPFNDGEAKLIHWDIQTDFLLKGNQLVIVHVLYNLLKNSLYQINKTKKGNVQIWAETKQGYNVLHFKDTAKGISKKELINLLDQPKNTLKTGLYFCKEVMENLGGKITCHSIESEYAEFELHFPVTIKKFNNDL